MKDQPEVLEVENPSALYDDPPRETSSDRFRFFARSSKRLIFGVLLIAMTAGIAGALTQTPSYDRLLEGYFAMRQGPDSSGYLAASAHISAAELKANYETHRRLLGSVDYNAFAAEQFETDILLRAALDEGLLSSPEAKVILESALRRAAAQYYIRKKFQNELTAAPVSAGEAKLVFEKTRAAMKELKLSDREAFASITSTLEAMQARELRAKEQFLRQELAAKLRASYPQKAPEMLR